MGRILMVDDHALLRDTLAAWLRARGLEVTCCGSLAEAVAAEVPDLVILDLRLADLDPPEGLARLRAALGGVPVLVMAGAAEAAEVAAVCAAGARAVLGKALPPERILQEIEALTGAGAPPPLSPREQEILTGLAQGHPNKEIARQLGLQEVTVKLHVQRLSRKLGARNRTQAALIGRDRGLV